MSRPEHPYGNLVLTRGEGESVHIGAEITVHVVKVEGGRVRLAIVAPKSLNILRDNTKVTEKKQ